MGIRVIRTRLLVTAGILGLSVGIALWGRRGWVSPAAATPPGADPVPVARESSDSKRVVAYIYDSIPITREELGEYLIARSIGLEDRIVNMVNHIIIDRAAKERGIEITAAEVEADFAETLKELKVDKSQFVNKVLKPHFKTLYEWKEDVIRPKLLLTRMCRERVKVTDEDLRNAYEAYYGDRVSCRMIMWPKREQNVAIALYPKIRDDEKEFDNVARHQATPELAAKGGEFAPFCRYTTGNLEMEKAAFSLKPGEISQLLETKDGFVVLKCIQQIPSTHEKTLDQVRADLTEDIIKRKISQQEIPKMFAELRDAAHPKIFAKGGLSGEDIMVETQRMLRAEAAEARAEK